jgi:hypothetical protein
MQFVSIALFTMMKIQLYKSLSEKVEQLIDLYQDQWKKLAEELEKLRNVAITGRQEERGDEPGGHYVL